MFAGSLDRLLPPDSVARAIWAGVERLDFGPLDGLYKNDAVGRPGVNPRGLVAVWMLALLRGETSSVRVAQLCGQDVELRWLVGDGAVEKTPLCDFRKDHRAEIVSLSAQVLASLGAHGLLPGEPMGVDGTIVRAASSRHSVKSRRRLERHRAHLEELLAQKLSEPESEERSEAVQQLEKRRERLTEALEEMTARGLEEATDRLTVTEPDAGRKRQKDGAYAPGYNVQVVTDLASGAILSTQVVDAGNDDRRLRSLYREPFGRVGVSQAGVLDRRLERRGCVRHERATNRGRHYTARGVDARASRGGGTGPSGSSRRLGSGGGQGLCGPLGVGPIGSGGAGEGGHSDLDVGRAVALGYVRSEAGRGL